jgi:predicted transcriptional regulator
MRVLLSIKPEYAEKILNGTKRFEYRKAAPRNQAVRTMVLYATQPIGKVVGEVEIAGVLREGPDVLWEQTSKASGITRAFFDAYFSGRELAVAIAVCRPRRYAKPIDLEAVSGSPTPPQSFQYLVEGMTSAAGRETMGALHPPSVLGR